MRRNKGDKGGFYLYMFKLTRGAELLSRRMATVHPKYYILGCS